ncbi:uncharacterized protein EV154DRAFT_482128 [Mucor mucedo]|uniref:uncharacterized protein n=1 Tax=Mucor mucedo TaxID=29922 RepID=UPI00221E9836|nr:uncharacterized protein EV154DRAFT_482128 [Mucor mucedo]KAI7890536.1 hypothetical protein EV154DRAFT_482128 [Mucor mucedo]
MKSYWAHPVNNVILCRSRVTFECVKILYINVKHRMRKRTAFVCHVIYQIFSLQVELIQFGTATGFNNDIRLLLVCHIYNFKLVDAITLFHNVNCLSKSKSKLTKANAMQGEIDYKMFIIQSIHLIYSVTSVVSYSLLLNVIYYNSLKEIFMDHFDR